MSIEIERTYLAAEIPELAKESQPKLMSDFYLPSDMTVHPKLSLCQKGDAYEITKKSVLDESDASQQSEATIELNMREFEALRECSSRKVSKLRYSMKHDDWTVEVDVFTEGLEGLVLVDFEFDKEQAMRKFKAPSYCGADVTQEDFIAGGMLAGRTIEDIADDLECLNYSYPQ
ncbi:hypothetical protein ACTXN6_04630 [Corynebacterium casei]|uniref:hypothetical protein n=1 Tax=Corynebacterium casei TaxID=160386 RepID=UPI003F99C296